LYNKGLKANCIKCVGVIDAFICVKPSDLILILAKIEKKCDCLFKIRLWSLIHNTSLSLYFMNKLNKLEYHITIGCKDLTGINTLA
jgi:hypothetical protein